MSNEVIIQPNANFHHGHGKDLFAVENDVFKEYRKKWIENPKNFHAGDFPLFIDIEVTSACDLKCPFCATTYLGSSMKKGFIEEDTVKKIIDEGVAAGLYGVKFNIRGEPLLHKKIANFVAYAKKAGLIDVYFNTNAQLLTAETSEKLIDAGMDRISISAEGYEKEFYERHRVGANFERVIKNIEDLIEMKVKKGVSNPQIRIQTVMTDEVRPLFDKYKSFWKDYADEIAYLDFKEMADKKKGTSAEWACPQLWQRMAVWWDGTMLPCNHDDFAHMKLGNAKDMSIKDAWRLIDKYRQVHIAGNAHTLSSCDGCYLRDSEIEKLRTQS